MAAERMSSLPFSPVRPKRRTSDKLIFISCEGSVTEWEYFEKIINMVFANIGSKVKIINVLEEALKKRDKNRTSDEKKQVSSSKPQNLLDKMNDFKSAHKDDYDFDEHGQDEFWLIMDVDDHTDQTIVDSEGKSNLDKWNAVLNECHNNKYQYAVSNPFFELWLLLHFDDVNEEDYGYAVKDSHSYESTSHFRERLTALKVPLKKDKHFDARYYSKYSKEAINSAILCAECLDSEPKCDYPVDLGSTVYRLLKSIKEIDDQYEGN